jgi:hypothetical protein
MVVDLPKEIHGVSPGGDSRMCVSPQSGLTASIELGETSPVDAWIARTHSLIYTPSGRGACIDPSHPRSHGMVHRFSVPDSKPVSHLRDTVRDGYETWTHWDLNPGPPPCKGGALPLSYGPVRRTVLALVVHRCSVGHRVPSRYPPMKVGRV